MKGLSKRKAVSKPINPNTTLGIRSTQSFSEQNFDAHWQDVCVEIDQQMQSHVFDENDTQDAFTLCHRQLKIAHGYGSAQVKRNSV